MAQRYDNVQLRATVTEEGYIKDSPVVGRVGIQIYRNEDGSIRREFRPAEEVFNAESLASYSGKPITDGHPKKDVNADNYKLLTVGSMLSNGIQEGNNVKTDIIINDANAIDKVLNGGKRELSLGYSLDLEETSGEWEGQTYDAIQRNIRINHLAIVAKGRAGNARLNLDAADAVQIDEGEQLNHDEERMTKIRLDGIDYEAAPEVVRELEKARSDAANLEKSVEAAKTETATMTAERDKLQARVDGIDAELKQAREDAVKEFSMRADAAECAKGYGVSIKPEMSIMDIQKAVILAHRSDAKLDDKSADYISGAYDLAKSALADKAIAIQRKSVRGDADNKRCDADDARAKMIARMKGEGV